MNILQIHKYGIKEQFKYTPLDVLSYGGKSWQDNTPSFTNMAENFSIFLQGLSAPTFDLTKNLFEQSKLQTLPTPNTSQQEFLNLIQNRLKQDKSFNYELDPTLLESAQQLFGQDYKNQINTYLDYKNDTSNPLKQIYGYSYGDTQNFQGNNLFQINPNPQPQLTLEQFQQQEQQEQQEINEFEVKKQKQKNEIYSKYGSVNQSIGKVGDISLNIGNILGQIYTGTKVGHQNADLGKIIGSTTTGIQTSINASKNIGSLMKQASEVGGLKNLPGGGTAMAGNIGAIAGTVSGIADSFLGERSEYSGDYGSITKTIDSVYDGISDAAMSFGPIGMLVGGAMKTADLFGDAMGKLGGGTDGMTVQDAILGSSLFSWNVGLINGFGGKTTDTISKNNEAFAQVGSSYSGTGSMVDNAITKSGKKYGLFSKSAYNKAQALINESKRQQNIMSGIAADATDRFAIRDSMNTINAERRNVALNGGYRQANVRVGRYGMILQRTRDIINKANTTFIEEIQLPTFIEELEIPSFKTGGQLTTYIEELEIPTYIEELSIEIFKDGGQVKEESKKTVKRRKYKDSYQQFLETLPEDIRNLEDFRMKDYWIFNGMPKNYEEAVELEMFNDDGANLTQFNPQNGHIEFMKSSNSSEVKKEVLQYDYDLISEFKEGEQIYTSLQGEELKEWQEFKKHWKLIKSEPYYYYEKIDEEDVPEYRLGGKVNVIPEGALHARLHHIDIDQITRKGIPVISETENGIEQQAEIEHSEIIFNLQTTKRLEDLQKEFYNEETSQKRKDELAIEAGKILTYEILYNTQDNTNLINEIK